MESDEPISANDLAKYLREVVAELTRMARSAGMKSTAAALDLAADVAEYETGQDTNAEPDSAA